MLKLTQNLIASLPLAAAVPSIARGADAVPTGITSVAPSMFIFTFAVALLLTLLFRAGARHVGKYVGTRLGQARIRHRLRDRSKDVLSDFLMPGAYGGIARIDHAVLTAGGILCIRAVHLNGGVTGGGDDAQWNHASGTRHQRFLNPLIQNEGRARAIRKALPDVPVANLVVFTGKIEFSATPPTNVIHLDQLDSYIAKHVFGPSRISDWDAVWLSLNSAVLDDADTRKDFAAQISFT